MRNNLPYVSMVFMDGEIRQYEIGYILRGDLDEERAREIVDAARKAVEGENGIVSYENSPKKQKLAYVIKKHETAYFGIFKISLLAENLLSLKKSFSKLDFLRFSICRAKQAGENERQPRKKRLVRQIKTPGREIKTIKNESIEEASMEKSLVSAGANLGANQGSPKSETNEPLQVEELDKKLEEILRE